MEIRYEKNNQGLVYARLTGHENQSLASVFAELKPDIVAHVDVYGAVLLRGLDITNVQDFCKSLSKGFGWNVFSQQAGMPGLKLPLPQLSAGGRYVEKNGVARGAVTNVVQGPHVAGGAYRQRARYLAFVCTNTADEEAPTGLVNLEEAYSRLSSGDKGKYMLCNNQFTFQTFKLSFYESMYLQLAAGIANSVKKNEKGYEITINQTPFIARHPVSGSPCIQPWPFAKNTSGAVYRAAKTVFKNRNIRESCQVATHGQLSWKLIDPAGKEISWTEEEQVRLFNNLYAHSFQHTWKKNDILLLDNIRFAHFRMDGTADNHSVLQLQCNREMVESYYV